MHINLHDEIAAYDLTSIYESEIDRHPELAESGVDADSTAHFVLGGYFTRCLHDQLLVAMATGARVIDITIHPMIASTMVHHLRHQYTVARGLPVRLGELTVHEGIADLDFHDDARIDPLSLVRQVAKEVTTPEGIPRAIGERAFTAIRAAVLTAIEGGYRQLHLLLPRTALDCTRHFAHPPQGERDAA